MRGVVDTSSMQTRHSQWRVACIGDSLTRGDASHELGAGSQQATAQLRALLSANHAIHKRGNYPRQLQRLALADGRPWTVRNFGHSGAKAAAQQTTGTRCLSFFDYAHRPFSETSEYEEALGWQPHFVVAMLGTNDILFGECMDAPWLGTSLWRLLSEFFHATLLLLTPPPTEMSSELQTRNELRRRSASSVIRNVSRVLSVPAASHDRCHFVDTQPLLDALVRNGSRRQAYLQEDGIHLSKSGSNALAEAVYEIIANCVDAPPDFPDVSPIATSRAQLEGMYLGRSRCAAFASNPDRCGRVNLSTARPNAVTNVSLKPCRHQLGTFCQPHPPWVGPLLPAHVGSDMATFDVTLL